MALATETDLAAKAETRAATLVDSLPATRWLIALLVPLAALKIVQVFFAAPTADEAYYWLWGQHLDWSYYDHPPLATWLDRLSQSVFGWNLFALRAPTILSFAGSLWILWFWARRLAGRELAVRAFLAGTVAWLSVPMLMRFQFATTTIAASVRRHGRADLAGVASAAGYFDQAHLTRDFIRFAGVPPRTWLAEEFRNIQDGGHAAGSQWSSEHFEPDGPHCADSSAPYSVLTSEPDGLAHLAGP